jgi:ornithine cyclodeaminase/alanine dehydrogenase-like protein (mu-crystallin family)
MTMLLSNEDIAAILTMPDCLDAMEIAYKELGTNHGANGVRSEILTTTTRDDALYSLLTMDGVIPKFGIGAVRINSDILTWPKSDAGLRRVKVPAAPNKRYVGLVLLFSTETGEPLAIYPDGEVQRMRVGATCGIAAKYLARADASEAAIIGSGHQASGQAMAICAVRPIKRLRCYSPNPASRAAFAAEMRELLNVETVASSSLREAVDGADVVMCATNSMEPVLPADHLAPGMHVSSLKRLELDASTVARADVVVTHIRKAISHVIRSAGADLAQDTEHQKNALSAALKQDSLPELSDLLLGRTPGRRKASDISVFLNYSGLGYQFAATGYAIYKKAKETGIGRHIDTDWLTSALPS